MIIRLASYPKSGNTLLRSILATYFFSDDGVFNFNDLYKIGQFPSLNFFEQAGVDTTNKEEIFKNYIKAQKNLIENSRSKINFLKTHSSFFTNQKFSFSNKENTLGAIYVVRDPRNVVTSMAHHYQLTEKDSLERILDNNLFIGKTNTHADIFLSSWNLNYLSWKKLRDRVLIIKYEDLIHKKKEILINVFNFFETLGMKKSSFDLAKLEKVIESTEFNKMKKLEQNVEFTESVVDKKTGKKIPFFNLGPKNHWKNILKVETVEKLEKNFKKEMKELGYLL
jgi:hypothetical protein